MSNTSPHPDFSPLSSKSFGPSFRELQPSNIFPPPKTSIDFVNLLKESDQLPQRDIRNSFDALISNINGKKVQASKNIVQLYNTDQNNKAKIQQSGFQPIMMQEVNSESEEVISVQQNYQVKIQEELSQQDDVKNQEGGYNDYFSEDLAKILRNKEIPYCYVRSLLTLKRQNEVKTTRRLKVERYLEKRRKKTWDRKICYNCRQKVAEERLRIKGKFIKKRRAMEILRITTPIDMTSLKEKLQVLLRNKNNEEIDQIIKMEDER